MDHFAWDEKEAFDHTRNIISTLNFHLPEEEEERKAGEEPLHSSEELLGLAPRSYSHTLDVKMVKQPRHIPSSIDAGTLRLNQSHLVLWSDCVSADRWEPLPGV